MRNFILAIALLGSTAAQAQSWQHWQHSFQPSPNYLHQQDQLNNTLERQNDLLQLRRDLAPPTYVQRPYGYRGPPPGGFSYGDEDE